MSSMRAVVVDVHDAALVDPGTEAGDLESPLQVRRQTAPSRTFADTSWPMHAGEQPVGSFVRRC